MTQSSGITAFNGGTKFYGPDGVKLFQVTVIKHALRFYAKTKKQVNRAYTPSAMLRTAGNITGKTYKRGQYAKAAYDLQIWCDNMAAALPIDQCQ